MAKGFKDKDGKFHPTEKDDTKLSSRDVGIDTQVSEKPITEGAKNLRERKFDLSKDKPFTNNPQNELGLTDFMEKPFFSAETRINPIREKGNQILKDIVDSEIQLDPKLKGFKIHNESVFNEYNGIQESVFYARDDIKKLINWRTDGDPTTWKWKIPFALDNGQEDIISTGKKNESGQEIVTSNPDFRIKLGDDQNLGWISDGYKDKLAITIMSPTDFLRLASPRTLTEGRKDIRGKKFTEQNVDQLSKLMEKGQPINTVFLQVNENLKVFGHEGQHRALSAINAGIKEMPVYVYLSSRSYTDSEKERVSIEPFLALKPDNR